MSFSFLEVFTFTGLSAVFALFPITKYKYIPGLISTLESETAQMYITGFCVRGHPPRPLAVIMLHCWGSLHCVAGWLPSTERLNGHLMTSGKAHARFNLFTRMCLIINQSETNMFVAAIMLWNSASFGFTTGRTANGSSNGMARCRVTWSLFM